MNWERWRWNATKKYVPTVSNHWCPVPMTSHCTFGVLIHRNVWIVWLAIRMLLMTSNIHRMLSMFTLLTKNTTPKMQRFYNRRWFLFKSRYFASASFDKSVRLWNAQNGAFVCTFRGHVQAVYTLAWSADSRLIVSGSKDSTLKGIHSVVPLLLTIPFNAHTLLFQCGVFKRKSYCKNFQDTPMKCSPSIGLQMVHVSPQVERIKSSSYGHISHLECLTIGFL